MTQVSAIKVIKNDYLAFMLTFVGPVFLLIAGFMIRFGFIPSFRGRGGQEVDPEFARGACVVAACLTVLLLYLLNKRISSIKRIINDGLRVTARVTAVTMAGDRGNVQYVYTVEGVDYCSSTAIMGNRETKSLTKDADLEIAVDPKDHSRAVIPSLFGAA